MKRSEMILRISENLQKHENVFKGYANGSIPLKCACDNLAVYLMKEIENKGMLPPERFREMNWNETGITYSDWLQLPQMINEWEPED